jgi:hypothetical protein
MIEKASDLLEKFIEVERKALEGFDMPHMPTLGSAYEEITKQGIGQNFAIPKSLNLKVVSGFISVGSDVLPHQIDGMLVCGEGKRYGRTHEFIYPIDQVLCIFEVKKTLTKFDYTDAFDHLRSIRKKYSEHFESKFADLEFEPNITAACKHFSQITGKDAPKSYSGMHALSKSDGILFYALVQETLAPLSIVHGYGGYKTEAGMRNAFLDILFEKGKVTGEGLGIPGLPTLVTTNSFSIVKGGGVPYIGITEDNKWAALLSMRGNAARIMLEVIWSKISLYFNVSMPWGDDIETEVGVPLILAIPMETNDAAAWKYEPLRFSEKDLAARELVQQWQPIKVSKDIRSVINYMLVYGGYIDLDKIREIAVDYGIKSEELINKIRNTLLFKQVDDYIRPISSSLFMISNGEDYYLSSSRERLDIWCDHHKIQKNYINLYILD